MELHYDLGTAANAPAVQRVFASEQLAQPWV